MKLFLIRHGESIQNTFENRNIGLPDHKVYLTEKGEQEAKDAGLFLKEYVQNNNIDLNKSVMWVSPYQRTRETAWIINDALKIKKVKEDYALIEQRYGLFDDKAIETIKELYPNQFEYYDNWYQNNGKFYCKLPQGESPMDVAIRTRLFLETLYREKEKNAFIVSHGTAIRTIVMNIMHYSPEWFNNDPKPENCSIKYVDTNEMIEQYIYNAPKERVLKKD